MKFADKCAYRENIDLENACSCPNHGERCGKYPSLTDPKGAKPASLGLGLGSLTVRHPFLFLELT